ncbi:hypothetical protein [Nocardioides sp. SYSU DS0663]|uniref:hypothetical protein n=1 Tax=Nocardioides sp. SYSU DS0663 TaxID=3416445 RepID=UPI003F4B3EE9
MTAPIPERSNEPALDVDQDVPDQEHRSDLTNGTIPSAAAEAEQEHNAETSFPEPSQ